MKFNLSFTQTWKTRMSIALVVFLGLFSTQQALAQCNNPSQFGTINAPTNNTITTITTCAFAGEYSTINSASAGSTYLFNATGGAGNYITIRQGTPGGTVLGFGFAPISVVCTVSGPLYLHYNTNAACGTDGTCHTGTVQCTSCPGAPDPCLSISPIACATPTTVTLSGTGLWNPGSCGFSTPGTEKLYSFTPTTTGVHDLQVTSTNSGGFIDYFIKDASGGCSSTGWTCIDDIFSPTTISMGTLTAGTTYYILLDPETISSVTHTFQINCPVADPCAAPIETIACASSTTATLVGAGAGWNVTNCGFSTPGAEKVYSFTPTVSGTHTLQVTSASGGFVDYFFKDAAGGCSSTGWTCIDDLNAAGSTNFGPLTTGTTYYILLDAEGTTARTHSFQINCPAPPVDPCAAPIETLICSDTTSVTLSGSGAGWSPNSCGFSTPGAEKVYSFTPTVSGIHTLQVTGASGGFVDYFYKDAAGGCSSTGWTCIDDISLPSSTNFGPLTAGTIYYILLDGEATTSRTHTFQINCPAPPIDPCAVPIESIICADTTSITLSGTGGGWSPNSCGFTTPGAEKVYSFTPTVSGPHTLQVTAADGNYIDYFFKDASGGCSSTGWTCIDDLNAAGSTNFGPLTAGTTYYILLDAEGTASRTHTFQINCPAPTSFPSNGAATVACPALAVAPTAPNLYLTAIPELRPYHASRPGHH
ncbi:MAG: hypothetical protein IPN76_12025 [Saprospiraceae bacterium]|nr:hypothetical protein [Saprospiraceae bacterium]